MSPSPDPYLSPTKLVPKTPNHHGFFISTLEKTKVYLAGPMRGYDQYNFPAFRAAADWLRRLGFEVWSPAEYDLEHGFDPSTPEDQIPPLREFMKVDLPHVLAADALVMLDGWKGSEGACLEKYNADQCGIPSYRFSDLSLIEGKQMATDNDRKQPDRDLAFDMMNEAAKDIIGDDRDIAKGGLQQDNEYPYAHTFLEDLHAWENGEPKPSAQEFWTSKRVVTNQLTGGQKETRAARFDLLPWDQLWRVAELYAYGATKYEDRNWEQGYDFSLSIAALHRHMAKFVQGESYDQESGQHHLSSVVFHALALMRYEQEIERGNLPEELDNRPEVPIDGTVHTRWRDNIVPGQLTLEDWLSPLKIEIPEDDREAA